MTLRSGIGVETRYVGWGQALQTSTTTGCPTYSSLPAACIPSSLVNSSATPRRRRASCSATSGTECSSSCSARPGTAVDDRKCSRGCAFGDFDNDGDVDILVVNLNEAPSLLRNDVSGETNWLKVKLEGTDSNRSAIGATVVAAYGGRRQAQVVLSQTSFHSANDSRLHFGLGGARSADLEIRWPTGKSETLHAVEANALVRIKEGTGIVFKGALAGKPQPNGRPNEGEHRLRYGTSGHATGRTEP